MSNRENRFFMSLDRETERYIDETVEVINLTKRTYQSKVNKQAVIRGIIYYCKDKNLQFSSGHSRHVHVKDEKISK